MLIPVELWAFKEGAVRQVNIFADGMPKVEDELAIQAILERVFENGQNEVLPQELPSVSMGDVALLWGKKYLCCSVGWKELPEVEYQHYITLPQEMRANCSFQHQPVEE